ncbi:hypothetical protein HT102_04915 [Hoyosella sp. G463]|uniref:Uncharacterized protein n=1 Tax=Lolliginicoccus lacisalsi TaxID=2742202 RepID=A0A927JAR5_9ACTN|nr:hypothetical protein [Lolliginicoccus lacisalsi]MBD8505826.1 hypothetical protein [Lolliginicoccus lacisalsi]
MGNEYGRWTRTREPQARAETLALRAGVVMFVVGALALAAIFVLHVTGGEPLLALYLASLLCPLGFIMAVMVPVLSTARARAGGARSRRR